MAENSKIEWCDHTFNPWVGCTKISPGCDHCYAESWAKRSGLVDWNGPPRVTSESTWRQPLKWNAEAKRSGVRKRVFCASLSDVFDNQVSQYTRACLWRLIHECSNLDWLILTKRPQNFATMLPGAYVEQLLGHDAPWPWPHVWLGVTAENQAEADRRIQILLDTPAARRFVSYEPALEPLDITGHLWGYPDDKDCGNCPRDEDCDCGFYTRKTNGLPSIDWVIAGGESGAGARPASVEWFRAMRDQCADAEVAFFMKQMGGPMKSRMPPIPDDLMVRQFPESAA